MSFDIVGIRDRYQVDLATVIHVGANVGQEIDGYLAAGACRLHLFEPLSGPFAALSARCAARAERAEFHLYPVALGEATGTAEMHVAAAGDGAASSLLRPDMPARNARRLGFDDTRETTEIRRLDSIAALAEGADLMVIDVQGYELHVLRGAGDLLHRIRLIVCELNRRPTYDGSATVADVDGHLAGYGFRRVETIWPSRDWGDGLYVNEILLPGPHRIREVDLKRPRGPLRRLWARLVARMGGLA